MADSEGSLGVSVFEAIATSGVYGTPGRVAEILFNIAEATVSQLPSPEDFDRAIGELIAADFVEDRASTLRLTSAGRSLWTSLERLSSKTQQIRLTDAAAAASAARDASTWSATAQDWQEAADLLRRQQGRRLSGRLHILEGFLVAIARWDEVSGRVFAADSRRDAVEALAAPPLSLSEVQAQHVLDMQQAQLTALSRQELADEHHRLSLDYAALDTAKPPRSIC